MDRLEAAIANAYDVFSRYRPGQKLVVCNCSVCMRPETEALLRATPLRAISSRLLAEYTNSAHGYDEGRIAGDLRYFLPRYFELLAHNDPPHHFDFRHSLSRLGKANYRESWPAREADAVDAFFEALFLQQIADPALCVDPIEEQPDVESLLVFVAESGGNVDRLLELWDENRSMPATIRLAQFVEDAAPAIACGRFHSSSWSDLPKNEHHAIERRVVAWLKRPATRERLQAAFFQAPDETTAGLFSRAELLLV